MTQAEIRQVWKARVEAYKASGQSTAKWCDAHQINRRHLWYWLRKYKETTQQQKPSSPQWASVEVAPTPLEPSKTLQVKIGAASIEVKPGFNRALLSDVVRTLQGLC
jgi:transposase-like protein